MGRFTNFVVMNYLSVESLSKSFGEKVVFNNISFGIEKGQKVALIGVNGSGKSTLFKIITGKDSPDTGEIAFRKDITIGYLDQNPQFSANQTIDEAIFTSENDLLRLIREYEHLLESPQKTLDHQDRLQTVMERIDALNAWDYESQIKQILGKLGIYQLDRKIETLSGGQKKRVALAKVLIEDPEFLIMDEPTNHLDLDVIEWLETYLSTQNKTLLLVTHDRYFLESITNEILELNKGAIFSYKGSYSYFLEKKAEHQEQLEKEVSKAQNLVRKELDWIRRQPKARGTKAKYRIESFHDLKDKASQNTSEAQIKLDSITRYQGKKILEIKDLSKSFADTKILDGFNYTFKKNDRIGIIGKNGTGKTSFLKLLTGNLSPDSGALEKGTNTLFGYYTQQELLFDNAKKVIDVVTDIAEVIHTPGGNVITASQLLLHFQFSPEMQYNYVEKLSGGEKRRLQLLTVLIKNPNFLILDEPTNDLDIVTLNILEDYLDKFEGCLLIVTHDRYFMDRLVDHLFVFKGDGMVKDFPGNYSDYRNQVEEIPEKQPEKKPKKEQKAETPKQKTKLSFKEKREFESLEADIEVLESQKKQLMDQLNSGEGNHEQLSEWAAEIEKISQELEEKSDRWLELSEYDL